MQSIWWLSISRQLKPNRLKQLMLEVLGTVLSLYKSAQFWQFQWIYTDLHSRESSAPLLQKL